MSSQQLTVVLPMHNNERQIRSIVFDLLDLSVTTKVPLRLVIVDDGSTDDTFEAACELARKFPQIIVLRQPVRGGLQSVLNLVCRRMHISMAIVHDGVTPIIPGELKQLIVRHHIGGTDSVGDVPAPADDQRGARRFAAIRTLQQNMEHAHRKVSGFHWQRFEKPLVPRRRIVADPATRPTPVLSTLPMTTFLAQLPTGVSSTIKP